MKNIKSGKKFLQIPKEFENDFENIQSRYYVEDTDIGFIEDYLANKKETCLEQLWREALNHVNPRDKASRADKERITNILVNMKNWKLYDGNSQHKKRISGSRVGNDGFYQDINYGVQKAWVWCESEEEAKSRQEELKNKQKQADNENINRIMGTKDVDYFKKKGE